MLKIITRQRATRASHQFVEQLLIADGARPRPIAMMIGPVTPGGKKLHNLVDANELDNKSKHEIKSACASNAEASIRMHFLVGGTILKHRSDCSVTAEECEG
jgi:hypothetical protein